MKIINQLNGDGDSDSYWLLKTLRRLIYIQYDRLRGQSIHYYLCPWPLRECAYWSRIPKLTPPPPIYLAFKAYFLDFVVLQLPQTWSQPENSYGCRSSCKIVLLCVLLMLTWNHLGAETHLLIGGLKSPQWSLGFRKVNSSHKLKPSVMFFFLLFFF